MPRQDAPAKSSSRLVQIAAAIVIIFALRYAKEVLVPIALAVLFAFLLAPLVHRLERRKLPRVASVLIVVLLAFAVIGGVGVIVARQMADLGQHAPEYTNKIVDLIDRVKLSGGMFAKLKTAGEHIAEKVGSSTQPTTQNTSTGLNALIGQQPETIPKVQVVPQTPPILDALAAAFGPVLSILASAFIVIVLCIFMLLHREDLRDRVIRLVSHGHLNVTTQAMDDAAKRVSRYLLMQAIINGVYGCVVAIGLFWIGVPTALLWGLLLTLLRFIPYVGPWMAAAGPVLLAFVTLNVTRGFVTIGMYVGCEIVVSSFLEPWLYGANTGVSSIAILIAAVFWAWLWGGVGLLLATPLTVLLVVIGKYVPQLEFLSVLLGDEPVFNPPTRYYQRLLATDPEEASELIEQYLKEMPLEQVYENVMIPALGFAHRDRFRGRLDSDRADFIRSSMREEIQQLGERSDLTEPVQATESPKVAPNTYVESTSQNAARGDGGTATAQVSWPTPGSRISGAENVQVVCLPARDEADELAGMMFAQLLTRGGLKAEAASASALASEMVDLVGKLKADIVVVSALPPSAVSHARYLCKRLHQAFPQVVIVVGLWTSTADLDEARRKITCTQKDVLTTTFSDGFHQLEQLVHPLVLSKEPPPKISSAEDIAVKEKVENEQLKEHSKT